MTIWDVLVLFGHQIEYMEQSELHHFSYSFYLVGAGASCLFLGPPGSNWCFSFAPELVGYSAPRDLHRRAPYSVCESWFLIHQDVYHDLFVCI